MKNAFRRILFASLALLLCCNLFACGKKEPAETTKETETQETETVTKPEPPPQQSYDNLLEDELLGKVDAWRGDSETGTLKDRDQVESVRIHKKEDLDPYRDYLYGLTPEDEERIYNPDGACILIELTGANEFVRFGTSSILRVGSVITINISVDEVEEPEPRHTFFLLYFPPEHYNGEFIDLVF